MLKFLLPIACISLLAFLQGPVTAGSSAQVPVIADTSYDSYLNSRFGYAIAYPKNIFFPQPESDYGDGCIFLNSRQQEVLRVFGRYNLSESGPPVTLAKQYRQDIAAAAKQHKTIEYKKLGNTFYVLSGYQGNTIFYQKTILLNGALAFAMMQYPQTEKDQYHRLVTRVFASFK